MNAGYRRFKLVVKILLLAMLVIGGNLLSEWVTAQLDFELTPRTEPMVHRVIMVSAAAYTILLAFPFVPGVEIGLALIGMFGPKILLLVYLCTLTGLSLSFIVGACIPERFLIRFVRSLRLTKTSQLLEQLENLDTERRLQILLSRAPTRIVPALIRYRYLAIMVSFNLPGNALIGGGGGIALMAGMSRLFSFPMFLLSLAVAVSPVPLAILFLQN